MENHVASGIVSCQTPEVEHLDGYGFLFGHPILHSLSPLLHKTLFDSFGLNWDYLLLSSTDVKHFLRLLRDSRCYGSGVTMPNKIAIIPHLDAITPECEAVGACNTIFKRDSKLIGTNTDIVGIRESFFQNVSDSSWRDRPGLVIGGGGAARSAVYALVKYMNCRRVYLVNRDPAEVNAVIDWCRARGYGDGLVHVATRSQAETLEGPGAIVACVPNFPPKTEAEWEARRTIECFLNKAHKGALLEMCYHPTPWTEIGNLAERSGWDVILGTEAMVHQGFAQSKCWTGKSYEELPVQKVKQAVAKELSKARL